MFAILNLGSAQNPHVLRVRSGSSALSVFKLTAPITPIGIGSKPLSGAAIAVTTATRPKQYASHHPDGQFGPPLND
ncbi:hypothetical protein DK853_06415 [Klebsiella oxytoca]|nr:hypothetical protein CEQ13_01785 [Klebsiella oxytoca]MBX4506861.1 hypothetical protein [Klebsiella oxytoca]OZS19496.1 hypothetical protein CIG58_07100 [Klebsiella oxytoca]RAZ99789.1 hypothetical protein DK853_06415 [Klebsiella oxytoca]TXU73808.1 hypothetical protein D4N05_16820 [Klebsiella oxytoca]